MRALLASWPFVAEQLWAFAAKPSRVNWPLVSAIGAGAALASIGALNRASLQQQLNHIHIEPRPVSTLIKEGAISVENYFSVLATGGNRRSPSA